MFVVDTNVLVYAANQDCSEHKKCLELVNRWRHSMLPWYVTWSIVYEFLRIVTHPRIMTHPWSIRDAWSFISVLRDSPNLGILTATNRHDQVLEQMISEHQDLRGNLLHDTHIVTLMNENGIRRIYTRDNDFYRFPTVEVLDPLREH